MIFRKWGFLAVLLPALLIVICTVLPTGGRDFFAAGGCLALAPGIWFLGRRLNRHPARHVAAPPRGIEVIFEDGFVDAVRALDLREAFLAPIAQSSLLSIKMQYWAGVSVLLAIVELALRPIERGWLA